MALQRKMHGCSGESRGNVGREGGGLLYIARGEVRGGGGHTTYHIHQAEGSQV